MNGLDTLEGSAGGQTHAAPGSEQRQVRHDFTGMRWGWSILKVWPQADGTFDMMGVGRGLKEGDKLVLRADQGMDVEMIINCVHYDTNPPDLFKLVARLPNTEVAGSSPAQ